MSKLTNKVGDKALDVVIVGCGMPKRGMGWYHLTQLMEMPNANVVAVVEPFFLNSHLCPMPPKPFTDLVEQLKAAGVTCSDCISKLPTFTKDTMCLIAGRTTDNPKLFQSCIEHGATVIYLEKPGAPTVLELQSMKDLADSKGVKVYLGYNKNVTPYVQKALQLAKSVENSKVTFCHNNSYKRDELEECFSRCSEGMLKNMAIHELALLVTFFGVTVNSIKEFHLMNNSTSTEQLTIGGYTDFSRIGFTVTTVDGISASVIADRCGGNISFASVQDANCMEIEKFEFPDKEAQKKLDIQCAEDPEMMPYFFIQSDDYLTLKNLVIDSTLDNRLAENVATIQIAIDALKLAEYFTEESSKILVGEAN